ncbi:hypothetical protein D3C74_432910 [compost metagenome]
MIVNIHIVQPHPFQALVEAGNEVFLRTPFAIRAWPHVVAGFAGDDQLVAVSGEIFSQNLSKGFLGGPGRRTVVVGQIEVGNPQVKGPSDHGAAVLKHIIAAKVMP